MYNVNKIIEYDAGEMTDDQIIDFFAEMISDGTVWHLQGSYGRAAAAIIRDGYISPKGEVVRYPDGLR